ncbi:MAG: ABC transporter permease [Lachnospiraceae bacterium]|nr:ABC transporter permease [Lachnospiraceae bacterium]
MGLMIKHSLKNIFTKPFRLLLLVFCISFASMTALLAVDMKNNIHDLMKGYMLDMIGKMDIIAYDVTEDEIDAVNAITPVKKLGINSITEYEYERDDSGYSYSFEKPIQVAAISDLTVAHEMCILPDKYELDDESVIMSRSYAEKYGKAVGEILHFETRDEVDIALKAIAVVSVDNAVLNNDFVIVSSETLRRIACVKKMDYGYWFLDVEDDSRIQELADAIREKAPGSELQVVSEMADDPDIQSLYNMFYLLFLISFLLVIFVTTSMAEKIVNERMSVIGTLRSLGVTQGKTTFLLLIENIIYAVTGTFFGILAYNAVKPGMLGSFLNVSATSAGEAIDPAQYFGSTPLYVYLIVLAGAILVECAYPLFELAKAVKTPIRDIIFDNKDTEFKYRWGRLYAGITLLVVSLVSGLLVKNFFTLAVSLSCGVVALAVLIPYLIRLISKGLTTVFRKLAFPLAQLASENISRNRIIMGTAVLCVTSLTLALLIEGIGKALTGDLTDTYDCDLIVQVRVNDEDHDYRYLTAVEGVTEADYVYETSSTAAMGDEKKRLWSVFADSPHTMLDGLPQDGYGLEPDEIVITEIMAKRVGVKAGDEVRLVFDPETDFPIERSFTIKELLKTKDTMIYGFDSLILNRDLYDHMFMSRISTVLLNAGDPESVKDLIIKNSESGAIDVKTAEEFDTQQQQNSGGLLAVLRLVVAGSVILTMIGIAGNQSIGFLTRKRETALLYSVAMPRHKLKRLLFLESLFSMGISAIVSAIASPFLYRVLIHLLDVITDGDLSLENTEAMGTAHGVIFLAIILAVFLLTTLIPSKYLKKMNIAEELKYE